MQLLSTDRRSASDGSGRSYRAITINPMCDATPEQFVRQLRGSTVLGSGYLVDIERDGHDVTVVLTDFATTKQALLRGGQLPRFCFLLPDEN